MTEEFSIALYSLTMKQSGVHIDVGESRAVETPSNSLLFHVSR